MSESSLSSSSSSSSSSSKEFTPECSCDAIPDQINARIVVWEPDPSDTIYPATLIQVEHTFSMVRDCSGAPIVCNDGDWFGTYEGISYNPYVNPPTFSTYAAGVILMCGQNASSFGIWWCNMTVPNGLCGAATLGYFDCPPIQNPITANYGLGLPFVELEMWW